jgi:hypothetical protein
MKQFVYAASIAATSLFWATVANADTISIGMSENGSAISTVASGTGTASFDGSFGTFDANSVTAFGNPPQLDPSLLDSISLDTTNVSGDDTLDIFVTSQGLTAPTGNVDFISSFTQQLLSKGWSVTEETFLDPSDGLYSETDPLGSATFSSLGSSTGSKYAVTGSGPYSLTEEIIIKTDGKGSSSSTIDLQGTTPLPGTLVLFVAGLAVLGVSILKQQKASGGESCIGAAVA